MLFKVLIGFGFAVALEFGQPVQANAECLTGSQVAELLQNVVAPNWATLTKDGLLSSWPMLREHKGTPSWPADIGSMELTPSGIVNCEFSFLIKEHGGIKSFRIVLSGTREQVERLGPELILALGFTLTPRDRLDYQREHSVILRRMNDVPPIGIDVDVDGTEQRSFISVQGYNFDFGGQH